MKLADFEKSDSRAAARFVLRLSDASSQDLFEITIAEPSSLVERMLAEAEIDLTIDSQRTQEDVIADFEPALEEQRKSIWGGGCARGHRRLFQTGSDAS
jgi:hypothetical protein